MILIVKCRRPGMPKRSCDRSTSSPIRRRLTSFVSELGQDLQDDSCRPEVRSLGRTITRWKDQIVAWHKARTSNGPTEAINNLIKRIKRVGFGFRRFRNYRIRVLLYAGRPNWHLLPGVTPRGNPMNRLRGRYVHRTWADRRTAMAIKRRTQASHRPEIVEG